MNYAIILAGGHGERFWPLSIKDRPKQLQSLYSDKTMLEETFERIGALVPIERSYIVTSTSLKSKVLEALPDLPEQNVLTEPQRKNTAAAICLAACHISQQDPDANMVVLPSDHMIKPNERFMDSLKFALEIINEHEDSLVIFGIDPTRADTNYGYIQIGDSVENKEDMFCYEVKQFREKPSRVKAQEFYLDGIHLWNSGMFIWKVQTIIAKFEEHLPGIYKEFVEYKKYINTPQSVDKLEEIYSAIEPISIDYGIMEKANKVYVVKSSFQWDDVGSWKAIDRIMPKDADNNIITGNTLVMDTYDSTLINKSDDLVVCVGFSDTLVVKTDTATLVINKAKIEEMRTLISLLKNNDKYKNYL